MRRALFAYAMSVLAVAGSASAANGKWIADQHTQCKVWDNDGGSNDTVIWTGACKNGFASGRGVAQYFTAGNLQARAVSLHPAWDQNDFETRISPLDNVQHIANGRAGRRGHQANTLRIFGHRTLSLFRK